MGSQDAIPPTPSANNTPAATLPSTPSESEAAPLGSNDSRRPGGVKAAKRALTQSELMYKKIKLMESSASETLKMSQKRFAEMARANDIQQRVVDMEVLSKDLSTCVDEFKRAYFIQAKKDIVAQLENRANHPPTSPVQPPEESSSMPPSTPAPSNHGSSSVRDGFTDPPSEANSEYGDGGEGQDSLAGDHSAIDPAILM